MKISIVFNIDNEALTKEGIDVKELVKEFHEEIIAKEKELPPGVTVEFNIEE